MLRKEIREEIEKRLPSQFPRLSESAFRITSDPDKNYNCIAWAAEENHHWWEPTLLLFWPQGVPREFTLAAYIKAYETLGYSVTDKPNLEDGFTKIAIYTADGTDAGRPLHASRQLDSGLWTSKLGQNVDIEHALDGLDGASYGRIACFLKRKKK